MKFLDTRKWSNFDVKSVISCQRLILDLYFLSEFLRPNVHFRPFSPPMEVNSRFRRRLTRLLGTEEFESRKISSNEPV